MDAVDSGTIRERFLAFFAARGHDRVASSSVVPDDPTLLLTNAGMNQFKPYFLGRQTPPYKRAVTAQKCIRAGGKHNDLEEVGKTARHLTFFEMLGNFSFGDYYKTDASKWAWELVTEGFGMDPDLLWVTVFETDHEAREIWADAVGVRPERIIYRGKADNFWSMGEAGPCGPCSEIFLDRGPRYGDASPQGPDDNEERYLEFWNLVFMQNDCNDAIEPVAELPQKNIDTGLGLERTTMLLQGVETVFETDVLLALIDEAAALTGIVYGKDARSDVGLRILSDHARSLTFMIADGVRPSNEERGYVLRRIMRRALTHARLLGFEAPLLATLAERCIELMGAAYPELAERRDHITEIAAQEEERFGATLRQGLGLLENAIAEGRSQGAAAVPGEVAFLLHDTFGFPIDMTTEIARESGLEVDQAHFDQLMDEQRRRAREARHTGAGETPSTALLQSAQETEFIGYEHLHADAAVVAVVAEGIGAPAASAGETVDLLFDRTVFYAEGGGQVGDVGLVRAPSGSGRVLDTRRIAPGVIAHRTEVIEGAIASGDAVVLEVDRARREGAERAHSATHVLHHILRERLGPHATQAGSLVEPGRLRFDFTHFEALSDIQVADISAELQDKVLQDDSVRAFETTFEFARSTGAMAIFGEKYGDFVRVVEIGEYSKELCGGTHVPHTSRIGVAVLTHEGSVGSNLRRVEALVGRDGIAYLRGRVRELQRAADLLRVAPDDVAERVEKLQAATKDMERRLQEVERKSQDQDAQTLIESAIECNGSRLVVARRDLGVDMLRALAQGLRGRLGSGVIVLGTATQGRANLVAAATKDLVDKGLSARALLGPGAELLGGGAGGKPELAISGGPRAERLPEAIEAVAEAARRALQG
ncbi:MAG: alanine--tRNA ligase [Actinomycetota bacterium]|nr:alanine--tRNA ligase [Actinomycetota bacterium]